MTRLLKDSPRLSSVLEEMSYEQFLASERENEHVEWVDGKVVAMAPVSGGHQDLSRFLLALLSHFVGVLRHDPFQMKMAPDLPGRAPDILFLAKKNLSRLKKNHLAGPADMVVEIISPGSLALDRGEKFHEYEQGGVREYWLLDPIRKQAEFYHRGRNGVYRLMSIGSDGIFRSQVLKGLWLKVDWLWRKPLPTLLSVLKEWKLI